MLQFNKLNLRNKYNNSKRGVNKQIISMIISTLCCLLLGTIKILNVVLCAHHTLSCKIFE